MSVTKILALDGLNDAKLAGLMEKLIASRPGIASAKIEYLSQKLTLNIDSDNVAATVEDVIRTLHSVDPNITIKKKDVGGSFAAKQTAGYNDAYPIRRSRWDDDDEDYERYRYRDEPEDEDDDGDEDEDGEEKGKKRRLPQIKVEWNSETLWRLGVLAASGLIFIFSITIFKFGIPHVIFSAVPFVISALYVMIAALNDKNMYYVSGSIITVFATGVLFLLGDQTMATAAILLYQLSMAVMVTLQKSFEKRVNRLIDICPAFVRRKIDGEIQQVAVSKVVPGDSVLVSPGETIPFDGRVLEGGTDLDASLFTGSDEPLHVEIGSDVDCGAKNIGEGTLVIEVEREQESSNAAQIRAMVRNEDGPLSTMEILSRRMMTLVTPLIVLIAALIVIVPYVRQSAMTLPDLFYKALTFLIFVSPCGLTAAASLSFLGGLSAALKRRILINGNACLETIAESKTAAIGLTGVLTTGNFLIKEILSEGMHETDLLELAAYAESRSRHPIAKAIVEDYKASAKKDIDKNRLAVCEAVEGYGARAMVDRKMVLVGNARFMAEAGVEIPPSPAESVVVYIAVRGEYVGCIIMQDDFKPDADAIMGKLHEAGIKRTVVLTGADSPVGRAAMRLGADDIFTELGITEKAEKLDMYSVKDEKPQSLIIIGNAKDDALFLSHYHVSVAMNEDAPLKPLEYADVHIPTGELDKLAQMIRLSRSTQSVCWQNMVIFVLGKLLLLGLSVAGFYSPLTAVASNAAISILLLANGVRTYLLDGDPSEEGKGS